MYTKPDLIHTIAAIGIQPDDTLLIHSSMKSIGPVEGGADTVLDAFIEYLRDGLLIFPTHTWSKINGENPIFDPATEPSCVGLLTNLFMKRPGVHRSWHPTHSVAALGRDAESYAAGEEFSDVPCSRQGCWGKLLDRKAKILFLGCSLKSNTILHGVEEWNHVPNRLMTNAELLKIRTPDGRIIDRPVRGHQSPVGDVSQNFGKMEAPLLHTGIARRDQIGDAASVLCDAVKMAELASTLLQRNPDLFIDDSPVPVEWYI